MNSHDCWPNVNDKLNKVSVVPGAQSSDEGNGKADVVYHHQVGNNAGHTVSNGITTFFFRLIPRHKIAGIIIVCLLIMVVVGGLFLRQNLTENGEERSSNERFQKNKRSLADNQRLLRNSLPSEHVLRRYRRGFRSYFYNYLDELAMGICASIPAESPGLTYAVRRTCGEHELLTCNQICTDRSLIHQSPKAVQKFHWTCVESLHVFKGQPALADNYEQYTDSDKLGLAVYRHNSCSIGKCGPNYCCCRATHAT